eukprot:Sspe_Gene.44877::Locus_22085_Transcript_1_1_Confidence_1.000_Length_2517::g.44877::m.44877
MDAELRELVERFNAVQKIETTKRLNERNCVEIIQKLQSAGLIDVIYTTNGKEYVTPQQLIREIEDELLLRGGRVTVVDLPFVTNVPLVPHVEKAVEEVLKRRPGATVLNGDLIDECYKKGVVEEIKALVDQKGALQLSEAARRFKLDTSFLASLVTAALTSGSLEGTLDSGFLYTERYVSRQRAVLKGAFHAVTSPCTVQDIVQRHGLNSTMAFRLVDALVPSLPGTFHGDGVHGTYTPHVYTAYRTDAIDSFYRQNGWITYQMLRSHSVANPPQWMAARFNPTLPATAPSSSGLRKGKKGKAKSESGEIANPDVLDGGAHKGVPLKTAFVSEHLLEVVASNLVPGARLQITDLTSLLPSQLGPEDVAAVVEWLKVNAPDTHDHALVACQQYLLDRAVLAQILSAIRDKAPGIVRKQLAGLAAAEAAPKAPKKGKGKAKSDEPVATPAPTVGAVLDREAVEAIISTSLGEGASEELVEAVFEEMASEISHVFQDALATEQLTELEKEKRFLQTVERDLQQLWLQLQLEAPSIPALGDGFSRALAQGPVTEMMRRVVYLTMYQLGVNSPDVLGPAFTLSRLFETLEPLCGDTRKEVLHLLRVAVSGNIDRFLSDAEAMRDQLGVYLKAPRPKDLKEARKAHLNASTEKWCNADPSSNPFAVYSGLLSVLVTATDTNIVASSLPGRCIPAALNRVLPALSKVDNEKAEQASTVSKRLQTVNALSLADYGKEPEGEQSFSEEVGYLQIAVRSFLH